MISIKNGFKFDSKPKYEEILIKPETTNLLNLKTITAPYKNEKDALLVKILICKDLEKVILIYIQ